MLRYRDYAGIPTIEDGKKACLGIPLVCDPGDRWEYGISTDWVGQVVERLSGQSLEDYFREHILDPLGMNDTGFVLRPEQRSRLARMTRSPARWLAPGHPVHGAARARVLRGRRRPVLHRAGLPAVPAHAAGRRPARWRADPAPGDRRRDGREPDRGADRRSAHHVVPEVSNTVEFFPGMVKKWGLGAMITTQEAPTGRGGRQPGLGGHCQHLLLDRSRPAGDGRVPDPDPAVRRCRRPRPVRAVRARHLRGLSQTLMNTTRTYTVVLTPESDGSAVNAAVPALPGVLTWGRTIDEAYASAAEAVLLHLEGYRERGQPFPHDRPVRGLQKPGIEIKTLAVEVVRGRMGLKSRTRSPERAWTRWR